MRGDARWDETWHRLLEWTLGQAPSERLAAQILLAEGFTDIDPSHPLGGRDGAADGLANKDGRRWVLAVFFPRGQQAFKSIEEKFTSDYKGVAANGADALVFVTNQEVRRAERRALADAVDGITEIFHLERLVAVLDRPSMYGVREQFLGIPAPDGSLDKGERLEELWRASLARCEARWQGVGLPRSEATALAADITLGAADPLNLPAGHRPIVVWTAPMGSGKSIAAERHHQAALAVAAADDAAAVPVFLRASDCAPSLRAAVEEAAAEAGEVRRVGASVVVDGVDEVGFNVAAELLEQARVLAGMWPGTTLLLTSRPVPALTEAHEHVTLPPLDDAAQHECVETGAGPVGVGSSLHSLPDAVRATIAQPFFALLVGLWMRERGTLPRAPVELMAMLGERATRGLRVDERHLRALASRSVARELGPVPSGDALDGLRDDELLATGMIERRGGGLAFVLPAIAQWFAAQALLLGEIDSDDILRAPEDLELWRYPLALAVSVGSADQARGWLSPLLANEAGFAMRVLDTVFPQAVLEGVAPPPWREGGQAVRDVLQALADALGPLARLVADVDGDGRVLPMGVASDKHHLTVAFWRGLDKRPDVFALPADFGSPDPQQKWGRIRGSQVGPGAAWAWHWAHKGVHTRLDQALRLGALPVNVDGRLGYEAAWAAACDLTDSPQLITEQVSVDAIEEVLARLPPDAWERTGPLVLRHGGRAYDVRGLRARIAAARDRGDEALSAPLPVADRRDGGSWIGELYSDARLVEIAEALYANALDGYRELVERWMPTLASQLEHYVLMPMRIAGSVSNGGEGQAFGPIPTMNGYIEALPASETNRIEIRMAAGRVDHDAGESSYEQQRRARPSAARWLTGTYGGMSFEVGDRYAVSTIVYGWLAQDLHRIGLVGGLARDRHNNAIVTFDT